MVPQLSKSEAIQKRDKMAKFGTAGIILVGGFIAAPIALTAIAGTLGLVAAGTIGMVTLTVAPVAAKKLANWKYRALISEENSHISKIKREAAENPIETLERILNEKRLATLEFKKNVETATAARNTFATQVETFKQRYPARAAQFESALGNLKVAVDQKQRALKDAYAVLKEGEDRLDEMRAYFKMSEALLKANEAANISNDDFYAKMSQDCAMDAVLDHINLAFAQVEVAAALETTTVPAAVVEVPQPEALAHSPSNVLETATVNVKEKVRK